MAPSWQPSFRSKSLESAGARLIDTKIVHWYCVCVCLCFWPQTGNLFGCLVYLPDVCPTVTWNKVNRCKNHGINTHPSPDTHRTGQTGWSSADHSPAPSGCKDSLDDCEHFCFSTSSATSCNHTDAPWDLTARFTVKANHERSQALIAVIIIKKTLTGPKPPGCFPTLVYQPWWSRAEWSVQSNNHRGHTAERIKGMLTNLIQLGMD